MFTRYKTDEKGRRVPVAKVYTSQEHNIHNSRIDKDCLWVVRKIWNSGYKAYIVGGSVRDMLIGKRPKDFDVATDASPRQIQKLFWNSRLIGKRFRIVHIYFSNKIIEVTTFRSDEENFEEGMNNIFGTIEQDSRRRDFSINALYYNPLDGHLLDFCGGMDDIKNKVIRSLIPLNHSFKEDPVRMIRAIKYMCTTGFKFKWDVKWAIRRDCTLIQRVSVSRLTDEMVKIFNTGNSREIMMALHKYKILSFVMPGYDIYMKYESVHESLGRLDEKVREAKKTGSSIPLSELIAFIVRPLAVINTDLSLEEMTKELFREIKVFISPMTPPNYEIERAVDMILLENGLRKNLPSRKKSKSTPRKKPSATVAAVQVAVKKKKKSGNQRRRKKKGNAAPATSLDA